MHDDADLMRLTAEGDESAFRRLVEKYEKELYNFFLRAVGGDRDDAADLTQQLFINLYNSAGRYKPTSSFKTFIYRIARNIAISHYRRSSSVESVSIEELEDEGVQVEEFSAETNPLENLQSRELDSAFVKALGSLPEEWRVILELRVGRDLSYKEIAEITGRSLSSVETIIFRARSKLAEELKDFR